jgi:hypothetical protein
VVAIGEDDAIELLHGTALGVGEADDFLVAFNAGEVDGADVEEKLWRHIV